MNAVVENGFLVFSTEHLSYYTVAGVGDSLRWTPSCADGTRVKIFMLISAKGAPISPFNVFRKIFLYNQYRARWLLCFIGLIRRQTL
jgi:hypothetical protein